MLTWCSDPALTLLFFPSLSLSVSSCIRGSNPDNAHWHEAQIRSHVHAHRGRMHTQKKKKRSSSMWAEALATRKKQNMEVVWRLTEGRTERNKNEEHNSDDATYFSRLFGCNAGITEQLYGRIIIYFHWVSAVKRKCLNLILSNSSLATSHEFSRMREADQKKKKNHLDAALSSSSSQHNMKAWA